MLFSAARKCSFAPQLPVLPGDPETAVGGILPEAEAEQLARVVSALLGRNRRHRRLQGVS
jgi:hypothetical protein